ncbi:MAG: sugar ABC transporter permease [Peptococcaceae bacterium]|nr:sugar ABC transporter permease [Peptococcaceae bacterium]
MRKKKRSTRGLVQTYAMLAPNLLLFLATSVYPILWALRYMFVEYDGINPAKFVGLDNFVRIFTRDDVYWQAVRNTLVFASGKIIIVIPLAFIVAILINKPKRLYGFVQAVIFSPTIMSAAVMALVFYLLFNVYNGEINRMLMAIGLTKIPINWLGFDMAMVTVIIISVWGSIGNYMVYFLAGLQQIPLEMYESADIDGASTRQKLFRITLPLLGPVLKIILMLSIIFAFMDMQSIMVLTQGGPFQATNVMYLYVYQLYYSSSSAGGGSFRPQYGYGAAVSVVSACIVGAVTVIYLFLSRKLDKLSD